LGVTVRVAAAKETLKEEMISNAVSAAQPQ
jgi:hypothetical protein